MVEEEQFPPILKIPNTKGGTVPFGTETILTGGAIDDYSFKKRRKTFEALKLVLADFQRTFDHMGIYHVGEDNCLNFTVVSGTLENPFLIWQLYTPAGSGARGQANYVFCNKQRFYARNLIIGGTYVALKMIEPCDLRRAMHQSQS